MFQFTLLTKLVALSVCLSATALTTDLNIVNVDIAPDGFTRSTVLAGGTFPGTLLTANMGDNFQINVVNQLEDDTMLRSTSIHWHGLFQAGTNWADGVAFVNQCPIAANNSFLYDFSVPGQAGSFWYHSHLATQYCDGLRGPIVLYDPNDPQADLYDIDDESTVITLADWYHAPAPTLQFPAADSVLINGLGRYLNGPASPLSVISVTQGKKYRMRLIAISCDPNFVFSIDGHDMTIIEADGVSTQPLEVDSIQIYAAQRYSFVLDANQPVGNYWIRALSNTGPQGFDNGLNSAILRYDGADDSDPTTTQTTSVNPMVETNLHPLASATVPGGPSPGDVDQALNLLLDFDLTSLTFSVNGVSFVPPTVPVLLQILSGTQNAADLLPTGSVFGLQGNADIEISVPGGVLGGGHPFHLHGHTFDVIRSASSSTYNYDNPVRRDTVNIGTTGDNVTIRLRTDNPGPWFFHCHIDWHLQAGLAIVFAEDIPDVATTNPTPSSWDQLCPIYDALSPDQL